MASPAPIVADVNGRYPANGGAVSSGLDGRYFDTNCTGCSNPPQPVVGKPLGAGLLSFGSGGSDAFGQDINGNGLSTRADRNAFYHLNIARLVAKKWLVNSYLETRMTATVNINSSCNAFYDRASTSPIEAQLQQLARCASCSTGGARARLRDVRRGRRDERATGGTTSVHAQQRAAYFNRNGPGAQSRQATTARGRSPCPNVASECRAEAIRSGEVHCEGEIYGQTMDLATALVARYR